MKMSERYDTRVIRSCSFSPNLSHLFCIQRLKAALWFSIGKMVDGESLRRNRNATPQFIGALTEMVWVQIGMLLY